MLYQSTRSKDLTADSCRAVLEGIAPDGGLYIADPSAIDFDWEKVIKGSAREISESVLSALLPDFPDMYGIVERAYDNKFETEDLTPTVQVGDRFILELFRGPTSAFKDVALSVLPQLITAAVRKEGSNGDVVILTATSGDTGKAALEGFHDVEGTRIIVFYPYKGVSKVQELQMSTQIGRNVKVCAVRGNFDDAQTGVKKVFAACSGMDLGGNSLSSANSINIGRLAPQVMYYFKAYKDLVESDKIEIGDKVDFVVPTGNFGDILAGYFAKCLGLPVGTLVCASNANNVLTDFISTGEYDKRREFYKTDSPSMDILVSSNLERLLFLLSKDEAYVAGLMKQLNTEGHYKVNDGLLAKLQAEFDCGFCDDRQCAEAIKDAYEKYAYLMDTHTAVAWKVAEEYAKKGANRPIVVLSTASPYKFPVAVLSALGVNPEDDEFRVMEQLNKLTSVPVPAGLSRLETAKVLHEDVIDKEEMLDYVLKFAKG